MVNSVVIIKLIINQIYKPVGTFLLDWITELANFSLLQGWCPEVTECKLGHIIYHN